MPDKDMLRMQEEAKRRVLEMQNRSRFFMRDMEDKSRRPPERDLPPDTGEASSEPASPAPSSGATPEEEDRLLVLSLLMLLRRENADRRLLLALLYIAGGG